MIIYEFTHDYKSRDIKNNLHTTEKKLTVYQDCKNNRFIVGKGLRSDRYILITKVENNDKVASSICHAISDWLYHNGIKICKTHALKLTKDKDILDKAFVREVPNPYGRKNRPMLIYDKNVILYHVVDKIEM